MLTLIHGDALQSLKTLPEASVDMCITSPPYWRQRDYGFVGQLGLETALPEYLACMAEVFEEVRRVLKPTGTLWINIGDTYAGDGEGLPKKTLCQVPDRLAIALGERGGWILRNDIIWHKPNPVPSSVTDRFTVDYEHLYFFVAQGRYYFDQQFEPAVSADRAGSAATQNLRHWKPTGQRNRRTVWSDIKPGPYLHGHPAAFPEDLVRIPILAGSPPGGVILDPFLGSGTTAVLAKRLGRSCVGIDANADYLASAMKRIASGELSGRA